MEVVEAQILVHLLTDNVSRIDGTMDVLTAVPVERGPIGMRRKLRFAIGTRGMTSIDDAVLLHVSSSTVKGHKTLHPVLSLASAHSRCARLISSPSRNACGGLGSKHAVATAREALSASIDHLILRHPHPLLHHRNSFGIGNRKRLVACGD